MRLCHPSPCDVFTLMQYAPCRPAEFTHDILLPAGEADDSTGTVQRDTASSPLGGGFKIHREGKKVLLISVFI